MSRLKVAMFTPLPPSETGTAEYAADLIRALEKRVDLAVFDRVPRRLHLERYDAVIYQIANNPYHLPFYKLALQHPGIVVLHEPNLHDLIKHQTIHGGDTAGYRREVRYEIYGAAAADIAEAAPMETPQPRLFPMLRRLLDRAKAVIVHSHYAAREVRLKNFGGPVSVIPHGTTVRTIDAAPYRGKLQIGPGDPVIGLFGYQRPDKRGLETFRVFRDLLVRHRAAHLLIAGKLHPELRMQEWIDEMGLTGRVHLLGFQTLEHYDGYLAACDVVLNLRRPTFGETSGTMMRAFGLGRTVVVSDSGAYREPPDDVCLRIPPDAYESAVLEETLHWLIEDRSRTEAIGAAAQAWVRGCCTWERVAEMYEAAARGGSPTTSAAPTLTCITVDRATDDPMRPLIEAHRALEPGGMLRVQSSRSTFAPDEIRAMLEDAGFVVISIELQDATIRAIARRDSVQKRRYPKWLYVD